MRLLRLRQGLNKHNSKHNHQLDLLKTFNRGQKVFVFALSYKLNALCPAGMVPLWPLPSPLPHLDQSCLVGIRNDPAGLQHYFFWGGGGEHL